MTIAISLKVHEGLVLSADSASTVIGQDPSGRPFVVNVYNNANKIFNLRKGLPIGASTWGIGAIGESSIGTLMKDLRRRFAGDDEGYLKWKLEPSSYRMSEVAQRVRSFIYDENYLPVFESWPQKPDLGLFVVGYSAGAALAEEYQIDVIGGECGQPRLLRDLSVTGMTWNGQIEAISRLVLGFSPQLPGLLGSLLAMSPQAAAQSGPTLQRALDANFVQPAMPLQDAIDLAKFLTDVAIRFSQFAPGAPSVGGPIEVAAISKHEGFKWVMRKHYYSFELNPPLFANDAVIEQLSTFVSGPDLSGAAAPRMGTTKTGTAPRKASSESGSKKATARSATPRKAVNGRSDPA